MDLDRLLSGYISGTTGALPHQVCPPPPPNPVPSSLQAYSHFFFRPATTHPNSWGSSPRWAVDTSLFSLSSSPSKNKTYQTRQTKPAQGLFLALWVIMLWRSRSGYKEYSALRTFQRFLNLRNLYSLLLIYKEFLPSFYR